jgi:uncharacterized protein YjbI with pentapeptide repeats
MQPLTQEEVVDRLAKATLSQPPLAGAQLGRLDFRGHLFDHPVDFSGATFAGPAMFQECHFRKTARFTGASFQQGANFLGSTFHASAEFDWARFTGPAYFWRSIFRGRATFHQSVVEPSAGPSGSYLYPGEANFSWAIFDGPVDFYRSHFRGRTYFWRTVFGRGVNLAEVKFDDAVVVYGASWEVCVTPDDFPSLLFSRLLHHHLLSLDLETQPGRYAHFVDITTLPELVARLQEEGFTEHETEIVAEVWQRYARPTFPPDGEVSFQGISFGVPERSQFMNVDLGRCLMAGANVEDVEFTNVRWRQRAKFLGLGRRSSVADEDAARTPADLLAVSHLYSQLRRNYERKGRYKEASGFYYGELETGQRAEPLLWRTISIRAFYKYLSGYGEQQALALLWLVLFVFVFFPVAYAFTDPELSFRTAVLHSLQVSTFLETAVRHPVPLPTQFFAGFERIAVTLQAGLVALTIRRQFTR